MTSDFDWGRTTALPADLLTGRLASEPLWVDLRWAKSAETMTLRHAAGQALPANGAPPGTLLALSDDGRFLAFDVGRRLLVWDREQAAEKTLGLPLGRQLHPPSLSDLVSGDGQRLNLAGRSVDFSVAAAEPRPSKADFQTGNQARADGPTHLRVGKLSATLDKQYLVVSDGARNQAIARLEHPTTVQLGALSEDGQRAATVDEAGTLRVWTLAPADLIVQACARGPKPISAATWAEYMPARVMEDACHRQRPAVNALR